MSIVYKAIFTIQELQNYLAAASLVVFDFETKPNEKYRNEDKAALDAHKSPVAGISFSTGINLSLTHRIGRNADGLMENLIIGVIPTELPTTASR